MFDEFTHKLSDEMIEWKHTLRHTKTSTAFTSPRKKCNSPMDVVHLTPTKHMRPCSSVLSGSSGSSSSSLVPLTCKNVGCVHRSAWVCTACNKETHLCYQRWGRTCFQQHCDTVNPGKQCCLSTSCDGQSVLQMTTHFCPSLCQFQHATSPCHS